MAKRNATIVSSGSKVMEPAKPTTTTTIPGGEAFLQRNRNLLLGVLAVIVLAAIGVFGYNYYRDSRTQNAQQYMFPAVFYFESDSLKKALNGDGANDGLLTIADEYSGTKAGKLADFYVGVAYMKQGKFDEAINYLQDFKSDDLLVQARAYALIGDAYMEKGNAAEAINYYQQAADYKPNKFFTPVYLSKLAVAYETAKNNQAAIQTYDKIIQEYPASQEATNAKKYKSRLEGLASK